jgi:serine/threonine protein kinase
MKTCPECNSTYSDSIRVCPSDGALLDIPKPSSVPLTNSLLDNRYRILEKIGEGGMGSVYKAIHADMNRVCAIKILTAFSTNIGAIARFKREARMASQIDHPNVVTIFDFGELTDGTPFMVMEYLQGKTLARILAAKQELPPNQIIHVINQVADALAAAHILQIVHRDLKPENIMIMQRGKDDFYAKLLDFGIARPELDEGSLTKSGFVLGTPLYMSPEQLLGESIDARSDIYSLAIIAYRMFSGSLPFVADNPQTVMMKRLTTEPVPLREVNSSVSVNIERVVMAALSRDPALRPSTVKNFAAALQDALYATVQVPIADLKDEVTLKKIRPPKKEEIVDIKGDQTKAKGVTVHLKSSDAFLDSAPNLPSNTVILRYKELLSNSDEHTFEDLIIHKEYEPLWRSLVHSKGSRILLTGYGPFGGTSLVRCALAKAKLEFELTDQIEATLLAFHFKIKNETKGGFEIEASEFGLTHLGESVEGENRTELRNLKAHAYKDDSENTSSMLGFKLQKSIDLAFLGKSDDLTKTSGQSGDQPTFTSRVMAILARLYPKWLFARASSRQVESEQRYDFAQFASDLDRYFKERKHNTELRQIVLRLLKSEALQSSIVFVFDRIRHLETIEALSRSDFFSRSDIRVIAVARKEDLDRWEQPANRMEAISFSKWYVPCVTKIDWDNTLFQSLSGSEVVFEEEYKRFLKHLEYKGRGSLGNIIAELKHPMKTHYGNKFSFINIDDLVSRAEIQHNAWMQDLLVLNWETILGDSFGGLDQEEKTDRAYLGVYYIIDWIAQTMRFSLIQLLKEAQKFPVTITDDEEVRDETINVLLYVLIRNKYLRFDGNKYHVIWSKNHIFRCRKIVIKKRDDITELISKVSNKRNDDSSAKKVSRSTIDPEIGKTVNRNDIKSIATELIPSPGSTIHLNEEEKPVEQTPTLISETLNDNSGLNYEMPASSRASGQALNGNAVEAKNKVFISYSHSDLKWLERLCVHLKPLERDGALEMWNDTKISSGAKWRNEIKFALESAKVALLLVSASFLASDFIMKDELPPLLTAAKEKGTVIVPLLISPSRFLQTNSLSEFQAINSPHEPLSSLSWHEQEEVFVEITQVIEKALKISL